MKKVHDIPTTIVTGFLGVGKSTAINSLLSEKPAGERWGVLVNEFGEIGVDATLIGPHKGVSIREIAGGCLCCTAGQAFEVALNRLIRDTYPDRILIEPTGIGHPLKIIRTLTSGYFCDILDLRATICLVDARKLTEAKYREHPVFQDQLNLADVLVGNKADCYSDDDCSRFMELVTGSIPPKAASSMISFGKLDPQLLELPRNPLRMAGFPDAHPAKEIAFISSRLSETTHEEVKPASIESWTMREGSGEGYWSGSWLIGTDYCFDKIALSEVINSFPFSRVKGIMQCTEGWLKINGSDGNVELSMSEPCESSRLEIIDTLPLQIKKIEKKLREINY
ncbi:MAG: GTP-binding protein [Chlorobiales bacterium]|nr:GTP-binding protein [Chlorobiales bacterium]